MTGALFGLAFTLAAPFWALMILLPGWSWTRRIIASPLIVLPGLVIYALLVLPALGEVLPAVVSPTLDGLRDLLGTADGAAAAWAHMIAFDLFARPLVMAGQPGPRRPGTDHVAGAAAHDPARPAGPAVLPADPDALPGDRERLEWAAWGG
nr:hypothetical protein GCM10020092_025120 [Actinoplanes digitatis]